MRQAWWRWLCVLWLVLLCALPAHAQVADPPTEALIRERIDGLAERNLAESEQRGIRRALEQTLDFLVQAREARDRLRELEQELAAAQAQVQSARSEFDALQAAPPIDEAALLADGTLEQGLLERDLALSDWQRRLNAANAGVVTAASAPEQMQVQINANQARKQEIELALQSTSGSTGGRDSPRAMTPERRDALLAEWHALTAQTDLLRAQLAGAAVQQDLHEATRKLATLRISRLEEEVRILQRGIDQRRSDDAAQAVAEVSAQQRLSDSGLLSRESALNEELSRQLLATTQRNSQITQRNLRVRQQLDAVTRSAAVTGQQIEALSGSLLLYRILLEQKGELPQPRVDSNLADEIGDARLQQFDLNKQRQALADAPAQSVAHLIGVDPEVVHDSQFETRLRDILATRADLLERLTRELGTLINEMISLQLNEQQLQSTVSELRDTIDGQMFWIPSSRPFGWNAIKTLPATMQAQFVTLPWGKIYGDAWQGVRTSAWLLAPAVLLCVLLVVRRRALTERLAMLDKDLGYVRRDSYWHTPLAIVITILQALPVSALLAVVGVALVRDPQGINRAMGIALLHMALAWLVFYTAYRLLKPDGVGVRHFRWQAERVEVLRGRIRSLGIVVVLLAGAVEIAERQPEVLGADVIGMLTFMTGHVLLAWCLIRIFALRSREARFSLLNAFISLLLVCAPLLLITLVMLGYYYTAVKLTGQFIHTLYLFIFWYVLEGLLVRSLAVAARRITYQRAVQRRESAQSDDTDSFDKPVLDVEQINTQSRRLLRVLLAGLFCLGMYWVWADLLTVFSYFDTIALYDSAIETGEEVVIESISLFDVMVALLIAVIAFVLAANLPGLLEVLVLSRLSLKQGSAYAITTLLSYIIVAIGIIVSLGTLGVSWNKLQWLVAALSVGIGFGLQEIFANFISGLIVLIERPVRIGDTVTIGDLSGTVNRIHIRATTITDFDHKEIVVPNKTFVTQQLINWSLSDTVTRIRIRIGVPFGSDLGLVHRLLLQAATENPRTMAEPPPRAWLLSTGRNTLEFDLLVHVRELDDRFPGTHEITQRVIELFRAHDLRMAYNQLDVNMHGMPQVRAASNAADVAPAIERA